MKNRSRLELTATILRVATEGMSSTKIMFNVYVSYPVKRVLLNDTKGFRFPTCIYADER
jgi:predicted transcriptional regulator